MKTARSFTGPSLCFAMALAIASPAVRATPLHPAFDLQGPGLSIAVAGAGFSGPAGRSQTLTVNVGGTVELALLYWTGRDHPCPDDPPGSGQCVLPETGPYKDQVLSFGGGPVTGILAGSEIQPDTNAGPINNLGYYADVTDQVRARGRGRLSFTVADGDPASNLADLDGAGLLVVYTDPAKTAPARVIVYHGLDFAYGEDRTPGETQVTAPFTFNHGASLASDRQGKLAVFVGDAEAIGPDRIDISHNPSLVNRLDGSAGAQWDADVYPVTIPAGAGATTVQVFSEPIGHNPDSLLWVMSALWVPLPAATGCSATVWSGLPASVWVLAGARPEQRVRDVFQESAPFGGVAVAMLQTALRFKNGPGLLGAVKELVRAGTAGFLNAGHPRVEYPFTQTQVITKVDTALRSHDPATILAAALELDAANGASCPLD
jgi:hypothetical protein